LKRFWIGIFAAVLMCTLIACDEAPAKPTADQQQQAHQEQMSRAAVSQTGMPGINNFTEMKLMKRIYEVRDSKVATFSYVTDMNGRLWHVCDSIGYGLPYGVQYSSPSKVVGYANGGSANIMPQSEPNGLFMPPSAEGTWVLCTLGGKEQPLYIEPRVIVSPVKLNAVGSWTKQ